MFIRSQDKMKLLDIVYIFGRDGNEIFRELPKICGYGSAGHYVTLGVYETKERVEEVINEITDAIQNYRSTVNDRRGYTMPDLPVFIMPID